MIAGISCVTFQFLESVFGYLQVEDIKSTRHEATPPLLLTQYGYSLTPKIKISLIATASYQVFGETIPELAYGATIYNERFSDEVLSEVSGHQSGHSQTPSWSQLSGNTDNALTTTYTANRKEDDTKHRTIIRHHLT